MKTMTSYQRKLSRGIKPLTVFLPPERIKDIKLAASKAGVTVTELIRTCCANPRS